MYTVILKFEDFVSSDAGMERVNTILRDNGYDLEYQEYDHDSAYLSVTVPDLLYKDKVDLLADAEMMTNDDFRIYRSRYFTRKHRFKLHHALIIQIDNVAVATQLKLGI
jgi:hypothetical protein